MLRALAALLVTYTHSIDAMYYFAIGWQQKTIGGTVLGKFGVDLFFVISGFVIYITAGHLSGKAAARTYLWHRFRRLIPIYYVATLLSIGVWLPAILRHENHVLSANRILSARL